MKSTIIPTLAVLMILQSCSPPDGKLVPDETAQNIFSPTELEGILKTISFVDSIILSRTNASDINQAYHDYFELLESYVTKGNMYPALLKDTIKYEFLESLNKESLGAVWRLDDHVKMVKTRDTTLVDLHGFKTLGINYTGKYMTYLKEIAKSDTLYSQIYESIIVAGDISPVTYTWYPLNYYKFDYTTFQDRLWAAVFLLSLSDPFEEQIERYLREKKPV